MSETTGIILMAAGGGVLGLLVYITGYFLMRRASQPKKDKKQP